MIYDVTIDGKIHHLQLQQTKNGWLCRLDGREVPVDALLTQANVLSVVIGGKAYEVKREHHAGETFVWVGRVRHMVEVRDPRSLQGRKGGAGDESGPRKITAPMPGKVVRVLVSEKAEVEAGQGVMVVEAMKMQNEIKSPKKGTVQKLIAVAGTAVNAGDVLAIVE
jgi:biotin carboxyl carrier protein